MEAAQSEVLTFFPMPNIFTDRFQVSCSQTNVSMTDFSSDHGWYDQIIVPIFSRGFQRYNVQY